MLQITRLVSSLRAPGRPSIVCLAVLLGVPACYGQGSVVRMAGGRETEGPFISPEAYAAYLEGTLAEAGGDRAAAKKAYERAIDEDPDNAAAWGRLGAVQCLISARAADKALEKAVSVDSRSFEAWLARAECDLARSDFARAAGAARRAVELSPESVEANGMLATALERSGKAAEARRVRLSLSLFVPVLQGAVRGDRPKPTSADVDAALEAGDYDVARKAAMALGMTHAELALHAADRGQLAIAKSAASRALNAEPENGQALIAALVVADLEGDADAFRNLLRKRPGSLGLPDPLAARLFGELLSRRAGPEAAKAWQAAAGNAPAP